MSGDAGVEVIGDVGKGEGWGEGNICENSDATAGGSTSGCECHTSALDP